MVSVYPMVPSRVLTRIGRAAFSRSTRQSVRLYTASSRYAQIQDTEQPAMTANERYYAELNKLPEAPFASIQEMVESMEREKMLASKGTDIVDAYDPTELITNPPTADKITLEMLLANQCHLGQATQLWHPGNSSYIFGIRQGIHIISLEITLAYLRRAAKVVHEVALRGGIILIVGTRKGQRDIVVSSAKRAEGYHLFERWIPGSLTNGQQILEKCALKVVDSFDQELTQYREPLYTSAHAVLKPDLVICLNPQENETCLHECGLFNIPTIGIVDTDTNPAWVTYPIPANDDSLRSVALISGTLSQAAAQGQSLRRELAQEGKLLYSTRAVNDFLEGMKEIDMFDARATSPGGGSKDTKDD